MGLYRRRGIDSIGSPIFHNYSAGAALANPPPTPSPAPSPAGASINVNPVLTQNQSEQPFFTPDGPKPIAPKPPAPRLVPPQEPSNVIPLQPDPGGGHVPAGLIQAGTEGEAPTVVAQAFLQSPLGKTLLVGGIVAATIGIIYWAKTRDK